MRRRLRLVVMVGLVALMSLGSAVGLRQPGASVAHARPLPAAPGPRLGAQPRARALPAAQQADGTATPQLEASATAEPQATAPAQDELTAGDELQAVNTSTRTPSKTSTRTPTPIHLGNFVWSDINANGVQDSGEPGIAGVTVQLWNAAKNDLLGQTTTNSSGIYSLVAPIPGDYRIRVLLPSAGALFTLKDQGTDTTDSDINPGGADFGFTDIFTIGPTVISITSKDAGIRPPPTPTRTPTPIHIGNFVWNDLNGNGVQDAGEPGLNGIVVQLWNAAKNDLIDQTTTNASGIYTLVAPLPGDYRLRVVLPAIGAGFTLKDQGSDLTDSDINPGGGDIGFTDIFTLGPNLISITSKDAGLINVPNTPTPTRTRTPTVTPTRTLTPTPAQDLNTWLPLVPFS